jgi:2-dehydro-3-deoxyglucarate aldolase/4-hydroxy-2-oxoheptanedioate aldolase
MGKIPAVMATDLAGARAMLDQGFRMLAYSGDLWIYQAALRDGIRALKQK